MYTIEFVKVDLGKEIHCKQLISLLNAYMEDEMGLGESMPEGLSPAIINGLKKHPGYFGFFVLANNEYAALGNCNMNFSTFSAKPLLNIHDVIVLSKFRGMGVGKFLLDNISNFARQYGCSKITLEVREDNIKARNLYQKVGFSAGNPPYGFWEKKLE